MKKDTLFEHKEVVVTCEKSMVDANEYQKLLEPPTKHEKVSKGRWTDVICDQCNKLEHFKECCHWNLDNQNNKLKNKKEVAVNGISTQTNGGTRNKFGNKGGCGEVKKSSSIIYYYFTYNFVEHKICDCLYKYVVQAIFKEKAMAATPKKDNVVTTWFW